VTYRRLLAAALAAGAAAVPVSEASAARTTLGDRHLGQGMRGRDVRVLQDFLTRVGLTTPVDGHYGPRTAARVRSWERKSRVRVDGRFTKRDAGVLRGQVTRGERVHTPAAPPAPAPAPAPTATLDAAGGAEVGVTPVAAVAPAGSKAVIGPDGLAVAPADAPEAVKQIIAAGNAIHDKPYRYGGGPGRWKDSGYDCSGSISYALNGAGLLDAALDSTGFMSWGEPGEGQWVTIYGNPGHAYMVVAGLRFDTSGRSERNSRWTTDLRSPKGFTARHPAGL
jgi:peptidoglycan hydrolase-like protein with peptidoglycan-binding domain